MGLLGFAPTVGDGKGNGRNHRRTKSHSDVGVPVIRVSEFDGGWVGEKEGGLVVVSEKEVVVEVCEKVRRGGSGNGHVRRRSGGGVRRMSGESLGGSESESERGSGEYERGWSEKGRGRGGKDL